MVHALDFVFVAEKLSYTPINNVLEVDDIVKNTHLGKEGIDGFQTYGMLRLGSKKII